MADNLEKLVLFIDSHYVILRALATGDAGASFLSILVVGRILPTTVAFVGLWRLYWPVRSKARFPLSLHYGVTYLNRTENEYLWKVWYFQLYTSGELFATSSSPLFP